MINDKSVIQVSLDGEIIETFDTISSVLKKHPNWQLTPIANVCKNKRKTAYGFGWYYVGSDWCWEVPKKILQIDAKTNEVVNVYRTIAEAQRALGGDKGANIGRCVNGKKKTYKGFIWKRG